MTKKEFSQLRPLTLKDIDEAKTAFLTIYCMDAKTGRVGTYRTCATTTAGTYSISNTALPYSRSFFQRYFSTLEELKDRFIEIRF